MPESNAPQQVALSVSDMARLIGLSRSRFHQLLKDGFFPLPQECPRSGRPFYDVAGQASCLAIRRTHRGLNGKTVMFYARRFGVLEAATVKRQAKPLGAQRSSSARRKKTDAPRNVPSKIDILVDSLKQMGLQHVTSAQATQAIDACFANDSEKPSDEAVLLAVFRYLTHHNSGGNVGR